MLGPKLRDLALPAVAVVFFFVASLQAVVGSPVSGGCTPAQQAQITKIEQIVLADILAGKTRAQIEADVGQALAGQAGADIAAIVDEVLMLLVDLGAIPAADLPRVMAMRAEHKAPCK
jgi:hypothetical protein